MMATQNSLDKSGPSDNEPLGGEDLRDASRYLGYLEALDSLADVEREMLTQDPRLIRAMVVVTLSNKKQREFTRGDQADPDGWDRYARWSRGGPLEETDG
jgi:hypothetical protein